jgi:hypothetical protein
MELIRLCKKTDRFRRRVDGEGNKEDADAQRLVKLKKGGFGFGMYFEEG